jgi:proteasome accessory factor B
MSDDRVFRLLKLLAVLQTGRPGVETLCTVCNVNRRTVFRDLDTLKRCGFIINFDKEQRRYSIANATVLPDLQLTLDEALAVMTLCFEVGDKVHVPFLQAARTAAIKIQGLLPPTMADQVARIGNDMQIRSEPVNPLTGVQSAFETIRRAQQRRRAVRITYKSPVEPEFQTLLYPYRLLFNRRSWYVIARSTLHREVRTFHVGRITAFEETDTIFKMPRGFTFQQYFRNAWNMIPEPGPDHDVVIRFSPLVARNVSEVLWHST